MIFFFATFTTTGDFGGGGVGKDHICWIHLEQKDTLNGFHVLIILYS